MARKPSKYTIPSLDQKAAQQVAETLQGRLNALNDLHLTLKHIHWNVVGPSFIGVHEMLDPQVEAVRQMADDVAERIATLGFEPLGTPGAIVKGRSWEDYSLNRAGTLAHMGALDLVYDGVITDYRKAIEEFEDLDLVTQDLLIDHAGELEHFQWFVRAHLENAGGELANRGAKTEVEAAEATEKRQPVPGKPMR